MSCHAGNIVSGICHPREGGKLKFMAISVLLYSCFRGNDGNIYDIT